MVRNKIIVPFIYSEPLVGRVTFPLKGFVWTVFLVLLALIIAGLVQSLIQSIESSKGFSFLLLYMAFGLCFIFFFMNSFIDEYFFEHINIKNKYLILKKSKMLSGGKEKTYPIGPDSKIVWSIEIKKIDYMEGRYNKLVFYDINNRYNILIDRFSISRACERSWINFLGNLNKVSNLKIDNEEIKT